MAANWARPFPPERSTVNCRNCSAGPVVEPVGDLARHDPPGVRVVGQDLDRHLLVDDLADLLLRPVGQGDPGVVGEAAEHHADLLAELVDEDGGGLGGAQRAGQLAQGLAHQPGLQADVAVAHLALDLGAWHERRHRVDDDDVQGAGADEHVGYLERLLTGVGLGHQQAIGVDAELLRVAGVEGMLRVDERRDAARLLRVGDRVQRDRGLAGALRAVDLDDPAAREAADAQRDVERDGAGRDRLDGRPDVVTEPHHRALAELAVDLRESRVERLVAVCCWSHGCHPGG